MSERIDVSMLLEALQAELHNRQRVEQALAAQQEELSAEIQTTEQHAEALAVSFKHLVQAAVAAYNAGDHALAKQLSNERKAQQSQCTALNRQANELRRQLGQLLHQMQQAVTQTDKAETELNRALQTHPTRNVIVQGFAQARGITELRVRDLLSFMPHTVLARLQGVAYQDKLASDWAVGRTGSKGRFPDKTVIWLYIDPSSFDLSSLQRSYDKTVLHEAGHVLFDWVLTPAQRLKWGELHNQTVREGGEFITKYAGESLREDFGECIQMFFRNPPKLHEHSEARYTFINDILKELNKV